MGEERRSQPQNDRAETAVDRAAENAEAVAELLARPIAVPDRFAGLVARSPQWAMVNAISDGVIRAIVGDAARRSGVIDLSDAWALENDLDFCRELAVERVIESGAAGDGREILEQLTAAGVPMRSVERGGGLDERQFNALSGFMRAKIRMIFADHLN
jgi:hypothetical protein